MPRVVRPAVRALLDSNLAETHDTLDIILPLRTGETELNRVKYFIASSKNVAYNGNTYLPLLRSIGAIKFSLGRSPDNAEVTIENVSHTLGLSITDSTRKLDGAKVIIRRAFKVAPDTFEPIDLMHGYIKDVRIDQELVRISIISDISRKSSQVASRAVTQRCIFTFGGPECGWTIDQGGNATFCNKVYEHADGCSGHNNQPRFGGVPTLSPVLTELLNSGLGNGWGIYPNIFSDYPWIVDPDYPFGNNAVPIGIVNLQV